MKPQIIIHSVLNIPIKLWRRLRVEFLSLFSHYISRFYPTIPCAFMTFIISREILRITPIFFHSIANVSSMFH